MWLLPGKEEEESDTATPADGAHRFTPPTADTFRQEVSLLTFASESDLGEIMNPRAPAPPLWEP